MSFLKQNARVLTTSPQGPRSTGTESGSPASAKRFLVMDPWHRQNSAMCTEGADRISNRHAVDSIRFITEVSRCGHDLWSTLVEGRKWRSASNGG